MGSGRDKRKKVKGHKPGLGALKTEKKTEKNSEKATRRVLRQAEGGEDDIDALLAKFKLEDEMAVTVQIDEDCAPPSARVYSSFIPLKDNEIIMFGGEWLDADRDKMYTYADVYILNTDKARWRKITSPGGPLPRSSHQAVLTKNYMWIFGGEFTSINQERFRHFNDLWRLDLKDWTWEQMPSKGGPSARSGHRMIGYKTHLLLFGGFYDSGKETKYYNDLWSFSFEDFKWTLLGPSPGQTAPTPRGGCQLALHTEGNTLYVIGGYSVAPSLVSSSSKGGGKKGGSGGGDEDTGRGIIHDDVWACDLKTWLWEKVKKVGMAPGPRTSFGLATHRQRAILFGGVYDREGGGDKLYSELYNEIYQFNFTNRRWFPLVLRPPKTKDTGSAQGANTSNSAEADNKGSEKPVEELPPGVSPEMHAAITRMAADKSSALYKAAVRIQSVYRGHTIRKAYQTYRLGGQVSELLYSPATYGIDLSATDMIKPRARSAAMMTVVKNTLWMLGGTVEIAHTDIVLDDLWSLDLAKLDGWKCVRENTVGEDAFKSESEDSEGWETE